MGNVIERLIQSELFYGALAITAALLLISQIMATVIAVKVKRLRSLALFSWSKKNGFSLIRLDTDCECEDEHITHNKN